MIQQASRLHAEVYVALISAVLECIQMPLPIGGMLLPGTPAEAIFVKVVLDHEIQCGLGIRSVCAYERMAAGNLLIQVQKIDEQSRGSVYPANVCNARAGRGGNWCIRRGRRVHITPASLPKRIGHLFALGQPANPALQAILVARIFSRGVGGAESDERVLHVRVFVHRRRTGPIGNRTSGVLQRKNEIRHAQRLRPFGSAVRVHLPGLRFRLHRYEAAECEQHYCQQFTGPSRHQTRQHGPLCFFTSLLPEYRLLSPAVITIRSERPTVHSDIQRRW